jgi:hypothetical protein
MIDVYESPGRITVYYTAPSGKKGHVTVNGEVEIVERQEEVEPTLSFLFELSEEERKERFEALKSRF